MSTTATATEALLTAEEYFDLPDDGLRTELVRGRVVKMPSPGFEHGEVQVNVAFAIKLFLKSNPSGRVVTESGTVTDRKPDTVRGPDVSYYSKERLPLDARVVKYHDQPPDLCVEVISPSNTQPELWAKAKEYFFAGVRVVWIVNPGHHTVLVLHAADPDEGRTLSENATLDGGDVLPGFSCKVADLFA